MAGFRIIRIVQLYQFGFLSWPALGNDSQEGSKYHSFSVTIFRKNQKIPNNAPDRVHLPAWKKECETGYRIWVGVEAASNPAVSEFGRLRYPLNAGQRRRIDKITLSVSCLRQPELGFIPSAGCSPDLPMLPAHI
jgi:hypothetical protein